MNFLLRHTGSIKAKLFIGFTLISVITLLAMSLLSMFPMRRMEESLRRIGHSNFQALIRISIIKDAQSRILASERTLLIRQLADQEIRRENYDTIKNAYNRADEAAKDFESLLANQTQLDGWEKFRAAWDIWRRKQNELLDLLRNQDALLAEGVRGGRQFDRVANQAFDMAFSELRDFRRQAAALLDDLVVMMQNYAKEAVESSLASAHTNEFWQILSSLAALAGSLIISFWLSVLISHPILQGVKRIVQVADGNLSQDMDASDLAQSGESGLLANAIQKLIESQRREVGVFKAIAGGDYTCSLHLRSRQDELGLAVRRMIGMTNETLSRVNQAVSQVTTGAGAINNASQSLSQGAIETAASLEEIS
ncbi:MAG: MCP four helix bundle domain-containing protein, partial [Planctomycetota bacterium]|nr:MCP four helix bundle domain-containing protein [Planctomycetota bacterium]